MWKLLIAELHTTKSTSCNHISGSIIKKVGLHCIISHISFTYSIYLIRVIFHPVKQIDNNKKIRNNWLITIPSIFFSDSWVLFLAINRVLDLPNFITTVEHWVYSKITWMSFANRQIVSSSGLLIVQKVGYTDQKILFHFLAINTQFSITQLIIYNYFISLDFIVVRTKDWR